MLAPMVYVMMMDAGLKQTTSVTGLRSRRRRAERSSELSLEGFEQRLRSVPQRERAARTLPGLISHWKDKLSKMYFPQLLKIRASTLRLWQFQAANASAAPRLRSDFL